MNAYAPDAFTIAAPFLSYSDLCRLSPRARAARTNYMRRLLTAANKLTLATTTHGVAVFNLNHTTEAHRHLGRVLFSRLVPLTVAERLELDAAMIAAREAGFVVKDTARAKLRHQLETNRLIRCIQSIDGVVL